MVVIYALIGIYPVGDKTIVNSDMYLQYVGFLGHIKDVLKVSSPYASASALLETLSVKGSVNTKKAGTYKVSCTITDPYTAVSVTKTFKFKVGKKPVNTTTEEKVPEKDSTQIKTQK